MASDLTFVEYVRDQINDVGKVSFRKIFGEYAIYYEEKVVALICDNQLFIKPTASGRLMIGSVVEASPYPGSKPHFLIAEQLNDCQWTSNLVQLTANELPAPKPKKAKSRKAKI